MSLQKMIEEIKSLREHATEDVNSGAPETLNARRGRKNQAIERLKQLNRSYGKELMRTAVFIVSVGDKRETFSSVAETEFGCFNADPEQFYNDLANRVAPVLYLGREGVSNIFDVLGRHLEDKMMELDVNSYNQLIFKAEYAAKVSTKEEFTDLVKRAINKQIGAEIAGIQAISSLVNSAIDREHSDNRTPIILNTQDETLALSLMSDLQRLLTPTFLVVTGKSTKTLRGVEGALSVKTVSAANQEPESIAEAAEKNKESVKEVLAEIKKQLRK